MPVTRTEQRTPGPDHGFRPVRNIGVQNTWRGIDRRVFSLGLASSAFGQSAVEPATGTYDAERTQFESRGRSIRAIAFRPRNTVPRGGVVFVHGAGGIERGQLAFAERFAAQGLLTFVPTYLDAAADDGVRPPPVMAAWRACASDAIEWLIREGLQPNRTAIIGVSLGAYIAVDSALGDSRAATAVGIVGGWDVYVPRRPVRRIPVLLVRAERDTHVRPASTERWRRFLQENNVAVRSRVIRDAGHILMPAEWAEVYRFTVEFVQSELNV